ncbi:MAG: hypothetical protein K9H26_04835 [Prolixibacteraceae bacterium]|nr:hypothetical protein [Prolixibacteraceae bacterium]
MHSAQSGYHICGITGQFGVQKKFFIGRHFFISAEAKMNPAWANVPISGGYAKVWVYDLQGLAGIGITF